MADVGKIVYIVVVDEPEKSFRYSRPVLQSTLQLMGCKPRHAFKISQRVFEIIRSESSSVALLLPDRMIKSGPDASKGNFEKDCYSAVISPRKAEAMNPLFSGKDDKTKSSNVALLPDRKIKSGLDASRGNIEKDGHSAGISLGKAEATNPLSSGKDDKTKRSNVALLPDRMIKSGLDGSKVNFEKNGHSACVSPRKAEAMNPLFSGKDDKTKSVPLESNKKRTTAFVGREKFLDVVCDALTEYKYMGPNQRADLVLACRIRERKESVTVLLCGTSGCGKSTLSNLLGYRLGITTVVSTDSIRHMMRSFADEKENPLLWASTYHAGECLDPVAVAEAKARRKEKKLAVVSRLVPKDAIALGHSSGKSDTQKSEADSGIPELISPKQMVIEGYKAQSEMVIDSLDRLITAWEERNESVVVEGVHLSLNFVMGLMKKHPSIIPFMIYIANEDKHLERFAVRAKYMTLDPAKNKYVKYIRNIRTIQDYLCKRADKHFVPKINNTNVDKSVAAIHATVFSCLRRREAGEPLYDPTRCIVSVVDEEYRNQCAANSLSSKGMFQLIQRKGSSRQLMALVNTDGSVAKAWPVDSVDQNGKPVWGHGSENGIGNPMYGPLKVCKAEPVNLQFGLYGISAWPSDGGTSRCGSIDESKADGIETGSRYSYLSSGCSSPKSDGPAKELTEDLSVHGSDEEIDDLPDVGSDEDLSDDKVHEEVGSVDEDTVSDQEYDDLAMQDTPEIGYRLDKDEDDKSKPTAVYCDHEDLDLFLRTRSEPMLEPMCPHNNAVVVKNEKCLTPPHPDTLRLKKRSLSIPALGN